jgi:hypothetical protein
MLLSLLLCSQLLLNAPFIKPHPYARQLQRKLVSPKNAFLKEELDTLAKNFILKNIEMRFEVYNDSREEKPHALLLFTFFHKDKPVGFIARKILKNKSSVLEAHGDGVYFDPQSSEAKGISKIGLNFIENEIYKKIGVKKEILHANYIGRYFWAQQGFQFNSNAYYWPGPKIKGTSVKPLIMIRQNFLRFLKWHKIKLADLSIDKIENFKTPLDFANVYHKNGKTILTAPLISENALGEEMAMPIGKSFMLSDNRPKPNEPYICSPLGKKFSDRAMPKWHGVRLIESN